MVKVFFSYAHRDEEYRNELEVHLAMLVRQGVVETWHDRRIVAGDEVHDTISEHIETSDVILLLVSPYFLASDYCYDVEMKRALERHKSGEARVIPIIIHPCDWKHAPFGSLRATPPDGKPISKYANPHDAYLAVTEDLRRAAQELSGWQVGQKPLAGKKKSNSVGTVPDVRSSNLRVKQTFSDRDRDRLIERAFDYIANFFENSLGELEMRNNDLETNFQRIDRNKFTAAVYLKGEKKNACRIWRGGRSVGDIVYASGDIGPDNTYNETLSVEHDGYSLSLRTLGLQLLGSGRSTLSEEGAAEYLWSLLIGPLQ